MMKFGESAARIERRGGSVARFVGEATEFYERCEGYGGYGNREVSRNDANRAMQRDPLVTRNDKVKAERFDSVEKHIATIGTAVKLVDSSTGMGIIVVPVFLDFDLRQWILWMEHYFARKGLTDFEKLHMAYVFFVGEAERSYNGHHVELHVFDGVNTESWIVQADRKKIKNWADFKQQLIAQFDPAMSCSAVDVKDESTFLSEGVHETQVEKHSTTVEEVSLTSVT
ncbi:hypothetical protein F2Q68_00039894 [Brassica cretica]|uniref:Uncharacterized protein n=1 Tax=Brassica cretica TaxID=69181 RepID=A0A8S9MM03_BRACR|nr:hypothetical protein F2Q68_00039894 [Brassica cretica]